jgi:hypothetical protein
MHVVLCGGGVVTVGAAPTQADLLKGSAAFCDGRVGEDSVWSVLHRECHRLFPDDMFADVFAATGRRSVPPRIVATVMVLQRLFGLSDREAVEAFTFDARWKYACGGLDFDYPGFAHTVLVDMRARLAGSSDPKRIFNVTVNAASAAGLVGVKRVLDSTPLYDAVGTMDTITLIRSAIRGLLRVADVALETELRAVLSAGDDYASNAKPQIDWDDADARGGLVDSRARDAYACLAVLDGRTFGVEVTEAGELLATVVGQDLEETGDGMFRIARRVAKDRTISTVDPDARHGHKTAARGFDGYKGHVAIDPDTEIITNTVVSAGNAGDASVAGELIDDLLNGDSDSDDATTVYGDSAYGTGKFLDDLANNDITPRCKTQPPPRRPGGLFTKDRFNVDLDADTVTCPNTVTVTIRRDTHGDGLAYFADACSHCPLQAQCTTARGGRTIAVGRFEHRLAAARRQRNDPGWVADYRATRPKVERKLGHMMRRRHGGRQARVRGKPKVDADFNLLAAAINIARLAVLGLRSTTTGGWATTNP